jgi:hypothetical protein
MSDADHQRREPGDLQHEQQQKENEFRDRDLALKEEELKLKQKELDRSRWYNSPSFPLLLAISGAIVTGGFGVLTSGWNSNAQLTLEDEKARLSRDLETAKSEAALILEIIKTNDPDKAANNLKFLLDAGLITEAKRKESLTAFLDKTGAGKGPSLPASVPITSIDVDPQFKQIQETFPTLGKPRLPAELALDAYQAVYENANILWVRSLLTIFVLPTDGPSRTTWQVNDTDWSKDPKLFDDNWLRSQFTEIPADRYPPHGGVAYYWLQNPAQWKVIGWRKWYCRFYSQIRYQQFENGTVFGNFHLNPDEDAGQIFVLFKDGSWFSRLALSPAPSCLADPLPHSP